MTQQYQGLRQFWARHKFKLNGLVLILPFWFLYQSLTPQFPPAWPAQQVGSFEVAPMPLNLEPPYAHHDEHVKDFMLMFNTGDISNVRQGYLNIGPAPLPLARLQQAGASIISLEMLAFEWLDKAGTDEFRRLNQGWIR